MADVPEVTASRAVRVSLGGRPDDRVALVGRAVRVGLHHRAEAVAPQEKHEARAAAEVRPAVAAPVALNAVFARKRREAREDHRHASRPVQRKVVVGRDAA